MASSQSATKPKSASNWGNLQKYCKKGAKIDVPILKKVKKSNDVYVYTIGLPDPSLPLGLVSGGHIKIYAKLPTKKKPQGELLERIYSPVSTDEQLGSFDLQFRVYRKGTNPKYPEGGVMTQYLESKNVGDKITISGPMVGFYYAAPGLFKIATLASMAFKQLGLICGGTGINVVYPVLKAIADNPKDMTTVTLLYANRSENDILMKEELDALQSDPRIKIYHVISNASSEWKGFKGYVTPEMIKQTMPAPGKDSFVFACGPVDMDKAVEKQLLQLKYKKSRMFIASDLGYFGRHIMLSLCCCCFK